MKGDDRQEDGTGRKQRGQNEGPECGGHKTKLASEDRKGSFKKEDSKNLKPNCPSLESRQKIKHQRQCRKAWLWDGDVETNVSFLNFT